MNITDWICETVEDMASQFEALNSGKFDYVSLDVKRALFFQYCFQELVLQKWKNDDLVALSVCVKNYY